MSDEERQYLENLVRWLERISLPMAETMHRLDRIDRNGRTSHGGRMELAQKHANRAYYAIEKLRTQLVFDLIYSAGADYVPKLPSPVEADEQP